MLDYGLFTISRSITWLGNRRNRRYNDRLFVCGVISIVPVRQQSAHDKSGSIRTGEEEQLRLTSRRRGPLLRCLVQPLWSCGNEVRYLKMGGVTKVAQDPAHRIRLKATGMIKTRRVSEKFRGRVSRSTGERDERVWERSRRVRKIHAMKTGSVMKLRSKSAKLALLSVAATVIHTQVTTADVTGYLRNI
jgi:hypothetical protein